MSLKDILKNLKFILIILLSISLSNKEILSLKTRDILDSQEFNTELINRLNYYRFFANKNKLDVDIGIEDNNFTLEAKTDLMNGYLLNIPSNMFLTSCDYFPLKEYLSNALFSIEKDFSDDFTHSIILTFRIMYLKYANHKEIEENFLKTDTNDDNTIEFYLNSDIKSYIESFPKNFERNIFSLIDEDIILATKININMQYREIFYKMYKGVVEGIKKLEDKKISVTV